MWRECALKGVAHKGDKTIGREGVRSARCEALAGNTVRDPDGRKEDLEVPCECAMCSGSDCERQDGSGGGLREDRQESLEVFVSLSLRSCSRGEVLKR